MPGGEYVRLPRGSPTFDAKALGKYRAKLPPGQASDPGTGFAPDHGRGTV